MRHIDNLRSDDDLVDLHAGEVLPVTDGPLVLFLALELEHEDLDAAAAAGNRPGHLRGSESLTGEYLLIVTHDGENAAELDLSADVAGQRFHFDRVAGRDAVLFAASFNDCVHN